ncbi:MAG: nucleotidyltransferase family protein [Solirubrobacterales bacterium]|nr:nucleotidyltransferase family protein [Solirubrobacterales bacterium]
MPADSLACTDRLARQRGAPAIWDRVEEIVCATQSVGALRHHGVELIAARAWRRRGVGVPEQLQADERIAAIRTLGVPVLLEKVRAAYDGTMVLMKGPEVGAHYPEPALRPFCDLDFLVDNPVAAHRALIADGFVEMGEPAHYESAHHLRPLAWPALPLVIELHREPNRPAWLAPPDPVELLELTQPSAIGVRGMSAPVPAAHALLLAAHGWAHQPLRRLMDLIDVMVVLKDEHDRQLARELALRWGLGGVWRTTIAAADGLLGESGAVPSLRIWARHLAAVRERTVFETHLTRWAGPVTGLPYTRMRALGDATRIFTDAARPRGDERWSDAMRRTRLAIADAPRPQSQHDQIKETRNGR